MVILVLVEHIANASAQNLTLDTGLTSGTISVTGNVGSGTALGTITISKSAGTTFSSTVNAATIAISDSKVSTAVTFNGNVTATTGLTAAAGTAAYNVVFNGSSNTIAGATTFSNTGTVTLGNGGDTTAFTGGVVATAPSSINLNGTVTAAGTGVITLGDANTGISVGGNSTVGGTSTGNITLGAATLADGVTLTVGTGIANTLSLSSVSGTALLRHLT
jgi:hypothetical protein